VQVFLDGFGNALLYDQGTPQQRSTGLIETENLTIVLPQVPGLGIKYDASHCVNRDGDYLREMFEFGQHIRHFHVKGTLRIGGKNIPDPPAGMDDLHWGAMMALLYTHGYGGALSIEPHSSVWPGTGARGEFGVRFTIDMMRKFIMG